MSERPELSHVLSCTSLPTLPSVGVQVLTLTRDPNVSLERIAKVLETDPALSAKVLKIVNSSVYGLKTPCTTIRRALNFLGLSAVKAVVLGFSLVDSTRNVKSSAGFDIDDHWRRSIFGAAAARVIAQRVSQGDPEEAFAAALFQDIGALAMLTALGPTYCEALAASLKDHSRHAELEQASLGFTHASCGAALAAKWRLPDRYVQAILHHHDPDSAEESCRELARIVGLGSLTANALALEDPSGQLPALLASARTWFGLSSDEMATLLGQVGAAAAELSKLFGKPVGEAPDPAAIMEQAGDELVNQQVAAMREADALRERNEWLLRQTVTDTLTGIGNRKRFNDLAERFFAEGRAIGRSFALIMCDADRFKAVNDTYGHHVGDEVLKELARRLTATVAPTGIPCRYGGEEFAVLIPGLTHAEACNAAEGVRRAIQAAEFNLSAISGAPPTLPVTISVGVACNDPTGAGSFRTLFALVEAADKALYAAKAGGRNRVCSENPPTPAPAAAAHAPSSAPPQPKRSGKEPVRILLVEDDPLAARMIVAVLQRSPGVEVAWVRGVEQCVEHLRTGITGGRPVHAVVSDYTLVGGTGLDILAAIKAEPKCAKTPAVLVSASDDASLVRKCLDSGAGAFLSKDRLIDQLPAWLSTVMADLAKAA